MQYFDGKAVGERISNSRRMKKWTQSQFAEYPGYSSERQLQRIESGATACSVDKLMEIAQALEVSTDYLLFGKYMIGGSERCEDKLSGLLEGRSSNQKEYVYMLVKTAVET